MHPRFSPFSDVPPPPRQRRAPTQFARALTPELYRYHEPFRRALLNASLNKVRGAKFSAADLDSMRTRDQIGTSKKGPSS